MMTSFVAALQRTIKAEVILGHPLQNRCRAAERHETDEATSTLTNTAGSSHSFRIDLRRDLHASKSIRLRHCFLAYRDFILVASHGYGVGNRLKLTQNALGGPWRILGCRVWSFSGNWTDWGSAGIVGNLRTCCRLGIPDRNAYLQGIQTPTGLSPTRSAKKRAAIILSRKSFLIRCVDGGHVDKFAASDPDVMDL